MAGRLSVASNSRGNVLLAVLSVVNVIATIGILVVLFISFNREKNSPTVEDISTRSASEAEGASKSKEGSHESPEHGKKPSEKKGGSEFGKMLTLDQFTVNLSTPGSVNPKFVRVNISLEITAADSELEVTSKMPRVRNAIIDIINSKRAADLATTDGREYLKDEIKNALNSFLISGKVKGVFFTNFAVAG